MRTDTNARVQRPARRGPRASTPIAYLERVNLAIDHVVKHLAHPRGSRLHDVARAAMLSPFHFHRVFRALAGVTLGEFVKRLRLDRALFMMSHARRTSLATIARASGFSSPSDFSRCFAQRFGASPSRFDLDRWRSTHRAELEAMMPGSPGAGARLHVERLPAALNPDKFRVRIRDLPARTVAYIRVRHPYRGGGDAVLKAVGRLVNWAERHELAGGQWLGYQWEDPEITPLERCVYHAAVVVPPERFTPRGEIGRYTFPPMVVAEVEVRGDIHLELRALRWLFGVWLPKSGYVPDDQPCFEAFIGRPPTSIEPSPAGPAQFALHAHLPVRRG